MVKNLLLSFVVLCTSLSAACYWDSYGELIGRSNGYRKGGGVRVWTPIIQQECSVLYGQLISGRFWNNWALGGGLGYRQIIADNVAVGVNGFVDGAYTDHSRTYGQGGVGLELFYCNFDLRANGYFPFTRVNRIHRRQESFAVLNGGTELRQEIVNFDTNELIYSGFDVSVGACIPLCCNSIRLRATYFYYDTHFSPKFDGGRIGAEYRIDNILRRTGTQAFIGGEFEYNRFDHAYGSAVAGIRIPIGCPGKAWRCCPPCSFLRRLGDPAFRNESLLIRERQRRFIPNGNGAGGGGGNGPGEPCIAPDGEPINVFYVSENGSDTGSGTFTDPLDWLGAAAKATKYDIIALLGGTVEMPVPILAPDTFVMKEGQILIGKPDAACEIVTPCGPLEIPLSEVRPEVIWTPGEDPGDDVILAASFVQIAGFDINANDLASHGIFGDQVEGVLICDMGIFNSTSGGIFFQKPVDIQILNSTIENHKRVGIELKSASGTSVIDNNAFKNISGGTPKVISILNTDETLDITITNNSIDAVGVGTDTGIVIESGKSGVVVANISDNKPIKGIDGAGIHIKRVSGGPGDANGVITVTIDGNELEDIGTSPQLEDAILLETTSGVSSVSATDPVLLFDVKNNTVTDTEGGGIHVLHQATAGAGDGVLVEGFIRGNTLEETDLAAIRFTLDAKNNDHSIIIEIDDNRIINSGAEAVRGLVTKNAQGDIDATLGPVGSTLGNSDIGSTSGVPAYSFETESMYDETFCITMQDNNTDRDLSNDIKILRAAGTLEVFDLSDLSADNNGIDVNNSGGVNTNTECTRPTFP